MGAEEEVKKCGCCHAKVKGRQCCKKMDGGGPLDVVVIGSCMIDLVRWVLCLCKRGGGGYGLFELIRLI